ncbi:MAG: DUF3143 domain-containing protein [Microcystaceae cyanobacterium]
MNLPSADTPLYNHSLTAVDAWLLGLGCRQDEKNLHHWSVQYANWEADVFLEMEELVVSYTEKQGQPAVTRSFKYSLSRHDIEAAVLAGP